MKTRTKTGFFITLVVGLVLASKLLPYQIGTYIFDIFIVGVCLIASMEMVNIMEKSNKKVNRLFTTIYCVFNYIILLVAVNIVDYSYVFLLQFLGLILYYFIILLVEYYSNKERNFKLSSVVSLNTIIACIYPSMMFGLMLIINHLDYFTPIKNFSLIFILVIIISTMLTDTMAYLVGRTFKGPKLAPKISPNKTISGAIGGLLGGIGGAMIIFAFVCNIDVWNPLLSTYNLAWWHFLLIGLFASAIGQCGDLFESKLKRIANIKDSGNLLPGHGGMLDRIDAMTFVTVFVFLVVNLILI